MNATMTATLTAVDARQLTARIRDALALADDLLAQAYAGRAWEALGHGSFAAYCAAELPELRHLKLRRPEREARIDTLLAAGPGITIPELVAATGSSLGTVHRYLQKRDGGRTRAKAAPSPALPRWAQVAEFVAGRGARGASCLEFERAAGVGHGAASAAFHAAEAKGRIRRDGRFRQDGYGVYVAVSS